MMSGLSIGSVFVTAIGQGRVRVLLLPLRPPRKYYFRGTGGWGRLGGGDGGDHSDSSGGVTPPPPLPIEGRGDWGMAAPSPWPSPACGRGDMGDAPLGVVAHT